MFSSSQRSLLSSTVSTLAAGVISATALALITSATSWRITYLAVGVGALVGLAAGSSGRRADRTVLTTIAAVISVLAVAVGDAVGWAMMSSSQLAGNDVHVGTMRIILGLFSGHVHGDGVDVAVRQSYVDDASLLVTILCLGIAAATAIKVTERMLAQQGTPAWPPVPRA